MITIPPSLQPGDTIGIVCPAGFMPYDKAQTCITTLQQWGYTVKVGRTLGSQHHYFSGTDEERLADLQAMLNDASVKAILCGRGGYGVSRIIDRLDFTAFNQAPKWVIGYSDITVLHAHLHNVLHTASLHSPMAGAFNDGEAGGVFIQSLRRALAGATMLYTTETHPLNRTGIAQGPLVGGNLTLVAHLVGSPSCIDTNGCILFLEDVGEYIYNIDRMFIQLKRAGMLQQLAGLVIGGFTEMKDTVIPFGQDVYEAIQDNVKEFGYPVCYGFPVGHSNINYALKHGVPHQLNVQANTVQLSEVV